MWSKTSVGKQWNLLKNELSQMIADELCKSCSTFVWPPQPLMRKILLKIQHLTTLIDFLSALGRVWSLVEVHHNLRPTLLLPSFVGTPEFVLGAGLGVFHRGTEAFPEDTDEDIAICDAQDS